MMEQRDKETLTNRVEGLEEREHPILSRLAVVEADMRWVKWMATAAAATGGVNLVVTVEPAGAILAGIGVFLAGAAFDVLRILRGGG